MRKSANHGQLVVEVRDNSSHPPFSCFFGKEVFVARAELDLLDHLSPIWLAIGAQRANQRAGPVSLTGSPKIQRVNHFMPQTLHLKQIRLTLVCKKYG